eukprot:TRINITY_DN3311_c0_g2_i2.p1 TRINITY_DN3311_c0_g2~~TRINITY_DN3311_c0_g2_i2.p1  ORF type:complete len:925 (-),score=275.28 TRINITY_DN3311_c0_g2_i2:403-3177(-)
MSWYIPPEPKNSTIPSPRIYSSFLSYEENGAILFGGENKSKVLKDIFLLDVSSGKTEWKTLRQKSKIGISRHAAVVINRIMYVIGGKKNKSFNKKLLKFDIDSQIWSEEDKYKGTPPSPRVGHSAIAYENKIYIFGGEGPFKEQFNEIFCYDITTLTWSKIQSLGSLPTPRSYHTATLFNDQMIIFGGVCEDNQIFDTIHCLNLKTNMWSQYGMLNAGPNACYGHTSVIHDNSLVIYGGVTERGPTNHIYIFNFESNKWNKGSAYNKVIRSDVMENSLHCAVLMNNTKIFIFGGMNSKENITNNLTVFYHLENMKGLPTSLKVGIKTDVKKEKKGKKAKKGSSSNVGSPYNVVHKVHVNFDYQWTGQKPEEVFRIDEKLGQGAYGAVFKAVQRESGFVLAIKEISDIDPLNAEDVQKEIEILKKCKNTNIVCYYGTCDKEGKLWILMDYCAAGSVRDLIERLNRPMKEVDIQTILVGTLKGLIYLHSQKIIHRDIKCGNILLTEKCEVKIADFGVSEQLSKDTDTKEVIGSPLWMAPEVINQQSYNDSCDIWSLGITVIEMAEGFPPYHELEVEQAMKMVATKAPPSFSEPSKFSESITNFISRCLKRNASERSKAIDLMLDSFVIQTSGSDSLIPLVNEYLKLKVEGAFAGESMSSETDTLSSSISNSSVRTESRQSDSDIHRHSEEKMQHSSHGDIFGKKINSLGKVDLGESTNFLLKRANPLDVPDEDTSEDDDEDNIPNFAKRKSANLKNKINQLSKFQNKNSKNKDDTETSDDSSSEKSSPNVSKKRLSRRNSNQKTTPTKSPQLNRRKLLKDSEEDEEEETEEIIPPKNFLLEKKEEEDKKSEESEDAGSFVEKDGESDDDGDGGSVVVNSVEEKEDEKTTEEKKTKNDDETSSSSEDSEEKSTKKSQQRTFQVHAQH